MWVKICANTNLEDALLAATLGADAVGFVFAPSVRQVTIAHVARIASHLPTQVERVGVFPAWSAEQIVSTVAEAELTSVQLHAPFDAALTRSLRDSLAPDLKLIQAVHWIVDSDSNAQSSVHQQVEQIEATGLIDHILVDSKVGSATGGTGTSFNWRAAESLFQEHPQLILAGGLRPSNVREAIASLQPWGVDVASGVEEGKGKKDPEKLRMFLEEARSGQS